MQPPQQAEQQGKGTAREGAVVEGPAGQADSKVNDQRKDASQVPAAGAASAAFNWAGKPESVLKEVVEEVEVEEGGQGGAGSEAGLAAAVREGDGEVVGAAMAAAPGEAAATPLEGQQEEEEEEAPAFGQEEVSQKTGSQQEAAVGQHSEAIQVLPADTAGPGVAGTDRSSLAGHAAQDAHQAAAATDVEATVQHIARVSPTSYICSALPNPATP